MVKNRRDEAGSTGLSRRTLSTSMAMGLVLMTAGTARADLNDALEKITARTTQARDKAAAAKDGIDEIRQRVKEGVKHLTGEVRAILDEQMERFQSFAAERVVMTQEFVSSGACEAKRAQLIDVLRQMQHVAALIQELSEICPEASMPILNMEPAIAAIEQMPCGMMIPLAHVEMSPCLASQLAECAEALQLIREFIRSDDAADAAAELAEPTGAFDAEYSKCATWLEHHRAIGKAQKTLSNMSSALSLIARAFAALGEKKIDANIGVHGYALVTLSENPLKTWGTYVEAVSSGLDKMAKKIEGKMSRCVDLSAQATIMSNQARILESLEAVHSKE